MSSLKGEEEYYRNKIDYDEFLDNTDLENEIKVLQKGKEREMSITTPSEPIETPEHDPLITYCRTCTIGIIPPHTSINS